jgi:putative ABC transport system permease protein
MFMIFLNIRQSFRNLRRNKIYSIINLAGLGISTAFILLVTLYVRHALVMDKYSVGVKQLYRIEFNDNWNKAENKKPGFFNWFVKDQNEKLQLSTPAILAPDLKKNFREIKDVCRIDGYYEPVIKIGDTKFKEGERNVAFVDKNFFSLFELPIASGNASNPFPTNNSVVISEKAARKYFGNENAIGKILGINEEREQLYTVSAVAKDFPSTSSMQFDVLLPVESKPSYQERMKEGLNTMSYITIVQLEPGVVIGNFKNSLRSFGETYFQPVIESAQKYFDVKDPKINLTIRSFSESHFSPAGHWFYFTDLRNLYQLILLALITLGIACLNYVLLSLSRVASRSQEAGIRKTVGAKWKHIIAMFLTETQILVLLSMLLGFGLASFFLPYFNSLTHVTIDNAEIYNLKFIVMAGGISVLLTIVAGIYPAIKMAGISPLQAMSKFGTYKLQPSLSRIFIVLQYSACIVLIFFSIVIARQINFVNHKDLGFDKEQIVMLKNPFWGDWKKTAALREQLYTYAATQPAITAATGSTFKFGSAGESNGHFINGEKQMLRALKVDFDYFSLNKISILKGRAFSKEFAIDTTRLKLPADKIDSLASRAMSNVVVNETLYNMLGKPLLNVPNKSLGGVIVGVCQDYFIESMERKIEPVYHVCRPLAVGYFSFRIAANQNIVAVLNGLRSRYKVATGDELFEYSFMDEDVKTVYESHVRWMKVIRVASWMTILIACLGLFGLSAIVAVNRTKEIGIRKILGASLLQLFYTLNRQVILIILFSVIIALPVAMYVSDSWLQNFAYRIDLHWSFFAIAALIGFLCALIAVSYHSLKVANSNPVNSLRNE